MIELLYFSGKHCSVCQALKPKLLGAMAMFPNLEIKDIDVNTYPEIAAQNLVFTLPVVLIMIDGKEQYRFVRSFSVTEVMNKLNRINTLYENN